MSDAYSTRLALNVQLVSAFSVEGTDEMLVTLRTNAAMTLELLLTQSEAAALAALIAAERPNGRRRRSELPLPLAGA